MRLIRDQGRYKVEAEDNNKASGGTFYFTRIYDGKKLEFNEPNPRQFNLMQIWLSDPLSDTDCDMMYQGKFDEEQEIKNEAKMVS
jgi:hypothetical protein